MVIGPPQEFCEKSGYPCDKTDCELYREWGFCYEEQACKKHWYDGIGSSDAYAPKWFYFGVMGCERCKHFKGFDLYKKGE